MVVTVFEIRRLAAALAGLLCLLMVGLVHAATITVETDRDQLASNETFRILFRAQGSVSGDPDFSPLERNFQILSTRQSSNFSIKNGEVERSKSWTLTVVPRHSGNLTIPAIEFGADTSPRSSVMVTEETDKSEPEGQGEIFLKANASPANPYVQAQVIYNLKLYRAVRTGNASLSEPEVTSGEAVIERLGEDKSYLTRVKGKRYRVVERRYAVYPQASGELTLSPVEFRGQVGRNAFSLLDPFRSRAERVKRRSEAVTLEVRPIPDAFTGGHWLPSKEVTLEEKWSQDPPQFRVGEPITRTLVLKAQGQTASQLPKLTLGAPDGFKQYPEQPMLKDEAAESGIVGHRREKAALIPQQAGEYTLPAIRLAWWNTETDSLEHVELPQRTVTVAPAAGKKAPGGVEVKPAPLGDLNQTGPTAPEQPTAGSKPAGEPPAEPDESGINRWLILSVVLFLVWLVTVIAWWLSRRKRRGSGETSVDASRRRVIRDLKQACLQRDSRRARNRLLQWGRLTWADDPPLNPLEVGLRIGPELERAVRALNDCLYSNKPADWDGEGFWRVFEQTALQRSRKSADAAGNLEPLHRL